MWGNNNYVGSVESLVGVSCKCDSPPKIAITKNGNVLILSCLSNQGT